MTTMTTATLPTTARTLPAARFLVAYVVPVIAGLAILLQGAWLWLPPAFLFVITPVMDVLFGKDVLDFEDESAAAKWRDLRYDLFLYAWIPLQLVLQGAALVGAARAAA